ncbi:MAG: hypothetical protein DI629_03520 [Mesorhizobium amorphae]|nr:MAG: hypothetical protein DI629_03520 [Mesorhizobium amorphae]
MEQKRPKLAKVVSELFFRDHARPVELLSLVILSSWAQFLLTSPDTFRLPRYSGFSALEPSSWATIIFAVIGAQIVALWPRRWAGWVRFFAMAMASGLWAIIAANFWTGDAPILARTFTSFALASVATTAYLGAAARQH